MQLRWLSNGRTQYALGTMCHYMVPVRVVLKIISPVAPPPSALVAGCTKWYREDVPLNCVARGCRRCCRNAHCMWLALCRSSWCSMQSVVFTAWCISASRMLYNPPSQHSIPVVPPSNPAALRTQGELLQHVTTPLMLECRKWTQLKIPLPHHGAVEMPPRKFFRDLCMCMACESQVAHIAPHKHKNHPTPTPCRRHTHTHTHSLCRQQRLLYVMKMFATSSSMVSSGFLAVLAKHQGTKTLSKFYCLRQVHLAENLLQATHTQNRVKTT